MRMTVADILRTKLEAIDADCESALTPEVVKLCAEARYDGSKFHVPSFQAAGALWLGLIVRKEHEFIAEIARVLRTPGVILSGKDAVAVRNGIDEIFSGARYLERMQILSGRVARAAERYGLVFDATVHRVDIPDSAYSAGAMKALRKARANVLAELDLHSHSNTPERIRSLSKCWLYLLSHPWKSLAAFLLLGLVPWLISKVSVADVVQWVRAWQQ